MTTNLNIDETLLEEAQRLGGKKTKRETVNEALSEYIPRRKQKSILKLFGTVDIDSDFDHKKNRSRRPCER
jgi:hypothetical protein